MELEWCFHGDEMMSPRRWNPGLIPAVLNVHFNWRDGFKSPLRWNPFLMEMEQLPDDDGTLISMEMDSCLASVSIEMEPLPRWAGHWNDVSKDMEPQSFMEMESWPDPGSAQCPFYLDVSVALLREIRVHGNFTNQIWYGFIALYIILNRTSKT